MVIKEEIVFNRSYYRKADKEAFRLSIQVVNACGFKLEGPIFRLNSVIPSIQRALWSPDFPEIIGGKRGKFVSGYEIVHQAMHVLVGRKYGKEIRNKPKIMLFSESLAGASEIYFESQFLRNGGKPQNCHSLRFYHRNSRRLGEGFSNKLGALIREPFEAFKNNAKDSMRIMLILLDSIKGFQKGDFSSVQTMERKLRKIEQLPFLNHLDFPNFLLFVGTYCGLKSSRTDAKHYKDALSLLDDSQSYTEFMEKLGVRQYVK